MGKDETPVQKKSREKLVKDLNGIYRDTYKKVLMLVETRTGSLRGENAPPENKAFRGHLLTTINNGMRDIEEEIQRHYTVEYVTTAEDVIVFDKYRK